MLKTQFTLLSKKELTHDVYELIYSCPDLLKETPKPGQYVLFQLAPGLGRSYSLSDFSGDTFTLVIKRIPDGKGSPIICDA
jgi:ferredoxin-NADP reductase